MLRCGHVVGLLVSPFPQPRRVLRRNQCREDKPWRDLEQGAQVGKARPDVELRTCAALFILANSAFLEMGEEALQ